MESGYHISTDYTQAKVLVHTDTRSKFIWNLFTRIRVKFKVFVKYMRYDECYSYKMNAKGKEVSDPPIPAFSVNGNRD